MERRLDFDWSFLMAGLGLATISTIALSNTSTSSQLATRQITWIGVGLLVGAAFTFINYDSLARLAPYLYVVNLGLLGYVLIAGTKVNGSQAWLDVGPFNIQPSESMKLFTVMVAARLAAAQRRDVTSWGGLLGLAAVVGCPLILVALQPDFGTAIAFVAVAAVLLLVMGMSRRVWILAIIASLVGGTVMWTSVLRDYQKERIRTFLSPESDAHAVGYQIIQSRIAIGSGGLTGKGFADGTQSRLDFLPAKNTDFIFSVVAEAWGLVGSLLILAMFATLIAVGFGIAMTSRDAYGAFLVLGIMSVLVTHVFVNLGMVTGLLPTIGIPLPLVSYGGSSIVSTLACIGLILNVGMRRATRA